MENPNKPIIDMTRDGEFVDAPRGFPRPPFGAGTPPLSARIARTAVFIAVIAGLMCAAALALWFALALIPVVLAASAVAWIAYKIQVWRRQR